MFVGSNAGAQAYIGNNTRVIDLGGNAVFPGFVDTHVHPPGAAFSMLFNINLFDASSIEEGLQIIRDFVEANPDLDAFWGSGFSMGVFSDGPRGPRKEWLDEICIERPIILASSDGHNRWMNSAAFAANNITAETVAPEGGIIHLTDDGELWGNMNGATALITMSQEFTEAQNMEALVFFRDRMQAWGFTAAMMDGTAQAVMWAGHMRTLENAGEWNIRANQMFRFPHETDGNPTTPAQFTQLVQNFLEVRDSFADSQLINFTTAKFFMDGVIEGMTAYMLEPYLLEANEAVGLAADFRGVPRWNYEELGRHFDLLMREGIQSHIHAIGDAATRYTLHALEYAHALHPDADVRNTITHLHVVHPDDVIRMGELGIIGATQPYWHFKWPFWYTPMEYDIIGAERAYHAYPVGSLIDAGVVVTFSGDYPVTVANPFFAMEAAVTRNLIYEMSGIPDITNINDPAWLRNAAERITIRQAIEAFTINGAYQLHLEDEIGSITVGKWADLVVLDQDLMRINPLRIDSTQVLKTIFAGEIVHQLDTGQRFDDVGATAWFYDYVMYVYANGIMVGTSVTPPLFSPNANIDRGMIVTMLYRMANEPGVADLENPFTDVADGRWYTDAVIWAAENGILNNVVDGTLFAPTTNVTREQMATFVHNFAIYTGEAGEIMALIELGFYDTADISEAALAGVIHSYLNGIIVGRPGNIFDPQGLLTRAETAAMIQRMP
jgi:predicted amidohydrolase YtcJ